MKRFIYILVIGSIVSSVHCSKIFGPEEKEMKDFVYPLKVGNEWSYSELNTFFNYRSDSIDDSTNIDSTFINDYFVEIEKNTVLKNYIHTFVIKETVIRNNFTRTSRSYYANEDDGLIFYAYDNGGYAVPKLVSRINYSISASVYKSYDEIIEKTRNMLYNCVSSDSLEYEDPPLVCYKYPLEIGTEWIYRNPQAPWYIKKKVVDIKKIVVPAGEYECFKIRWYHDQDDNGIWDENIEMYDYICAEGLIKRLLELKDLRLTSPENPETPGMIDMKCELLLGDHHLE